jgi:hypothetical protein
MGRYSHRCHTSMDWVGIFPSYRLCDNNANFRRSVNTIWEVELVGFSWVNSFKDIVKGSMEHFHPLFKDRDTSNIEAMMKLIRTFPKCLDQKLNGALIFQVSRKN